MFKLIYNFVFNLCKSNEVQILPIDENPVYNETVNKDAFDKAIEGTVYKLLVNKITRNLKLTLDDFNIIYLLPFDKKIKIIQLINRLMRNESLLLTYEE